MKNFNKILAFCLGFQFLSITIYSQHKCGSDGFCQMMIMRDSLYSTIYRMAKERNQNNIQNRSNNQTTIQIPVAVHFGGSVTSADMCCLIDLCLGQIEVLNEDFNAINEDINLYHQISAFCPSSFPLSALSNGVNLEFYLANKNHPVSSGLIDGQYAVTVGQISGDFAGQDWAGYLNIFVRNNVVNPANGLPAGGYSLVNGTYLNPSGNGVVVDSKQFGAPNMNCDSGISLNSTISHNLGRTCTHEIGHYFGLFHTFVGCNNGDAITDTPNQEFANFGNPTWGFQAFDPCHTSAINSCGIKDFFMNYMDYCDDKSSIMFTQEQANKMRNIADGVSWKQNVKSTDLCNAVQGCSDEIFTNSIVLNQNRMFFNNIIIGNGAIVQMHSSNFKFVKDKGIVIKNGGKLILQGSTINVCDLAFTWSGITVEEGGFLDTDNSSLLNCSIGVYAKNNSTLQINNLTIEGKDKYSGTGMLLENKVNDDFIDGLYIKNFYHGVKMENGNTVYSLTNGTIENTEGGVVALNSSVIVDNFVISKSNHGIFLSSAPGSMIINNFIFKYGGSSTGQGGNAISALGSPSLKIQGNTITEPYNTSYNAIGLLWCDKSEIINNPMIDGINGIVAWGGNIDIAQNIINTSISNNVSYGGGIKSIYGNGTINDNYLSTANANYSIETTSSPSMNIKNNSMSSLGSTGPNKAGIKTVGGSQRQIIEENVISMNTSSGILALNSSYNEYLCNQVNSDGDAHAILSNSEFHDIKGNSYTGGTDLHIRSRIGLQPQTGLEYHGNLFMGSNTVAELNEFEDLQNSIFTVNEDYPYHLPQTYEPIEWFVPKDDADFYDECGAPGPTWIPFNGWNTQELCKYWAYLKSLQSHSHKYLFIKLVHLLNLAKSNPLYVLPDCIKNDPFFISICGIKQLVDVNAQLQAYGLTKIDMTSLKSNQDHYTTQITTNNRKLIKNQIASDIIQIEVMLDNNKISDSLRLDTIKTNLLAIQCLDNIVKKWKETYLLYIRFIENKGILSATEQAQIITLSMECSDEYGDAIHLARAMAHTFDRTYYDVYDNCFQAPQITSRLKFTSDIDVYPNPSDGLLKFKIPSTYSGSLDIRRTDGQFISYTQITKGNLNQLQLELKPSLYLFNFVSDQGERVVKKVIIVQ
jgi:hypothetical protein